MKQASIISVCVDGRRRFEFRRRVVLIGGNKRCDVRIADPRIAGRIIVLCGLSGSMIPLEIHSPEEPGGGNGALASLANLPLDRGEVEFTLRELGVDVELRFADGRVLPPFDMLTSRRNAPMESHGFEFLNARTRHSHSRKKYLRERLTLLGRKTPSHIRMSGAGIEDVQCSILRAGSQLTVTNLYDDNRLKVNGQITPEAQLRDGDELAIGDYRMVLTIREDSHRLSARLPAQGDEGDATAQLMQLLESVLCNPQQAAPSWLDEDAPAPAGERRDQSLTAAINPLIAAIDRLAESQHRLADESSRQQSALERLITLMNSRHQEAALIDHHRWEALTAELRQLRSALLPGPPVAGTLPPPPAALGNPALFPPKTERTPEDAARHQAVDQKLFDLEKERKSILRRLLRALAGGD